MTDKTFHYIRNRVYWAHDWLIRAGESVSSDHFCRSFSENAPPIGWHLWHMARFADRFQSKLTRAADSGSGVEIWYQEAVASNWHLEPDKLGVFESGMGQAPEDATSTIVRAGQSAVVDYARAAFGACNTTIGNLSHGDIENTYYGFQDYAYDGSTGRVWASKPRESLIIEDLIFHLSHGSRHMGMMEALRGLLGTAGTLSV
jgi:hypothetical protein